MTNARQNVLWVDCTAGAVAGSLMLLLLPWITRLYALPRWLLLFIGAANLLYAAYSFTLAAWPGRSPALINLLIAANLTWSGLCLWLMFIFGPSATIFGTIHLGAEAVFVGALAIVEWRWRADLYTPQ